MATYDLRVDAFIERSAPFAQPIMNHLRELIHKACPDVEETWKWSFPHFMYKGSILCSMAAFKAHCSFGFWKAAIMPDPDGILTTVGKTAMGHLGQIRDLKDLPKDKILKAYIKEAMRLNDEGIDVPRKPKTGEKKELETPGYFITALKKNKLALKTFGAFSYSNKKEYVEWVTEAKTEATQEKRLAQAIEWLAEGKVRNWKYLDC
jgi:uncharacterized protein YdeI (YjbR/CyaY-like superfamily)